MIPGAPVTVTSHSEREVSGSNPDVPTLGDVAQWQSAKKPVTTLNSGVTNLLRCAERARGEAARGQHRLRAASLTWRTSSWQVAVMPRRIFKSYAPGTRSMGRGWKNGKCARSISAGVPWVRHYATLRPCSTSRTTTDLSGDVAQWQSVELSRPTFAPGCRFDSCRPPGESEVPQDGVQRA